MTEQHYHTIMFSHGHYRAPFAAHLHGALQFVNVTPFCVQQLCNSITARKEKQ